MNWNFICFFTGCVTLFVAHKADGEHCFWSGTAPFCDGACPTGYLEQKRDWSGDGETCLIGTKAFCCQACDWFGTAPFCAGSCPHGYKFIQKEKGNCWTGYKVRCCPGEASAVIT